MKTIQKHSRLLFLIAGFVFYNSAGAVCNTSLPETTPSNRFTNNLDGTVTDLKTGLMWKQCPEGMEHQGSTACTGSEFNFNWQGALQRAQVVNSDPSLNLGYNDWRVPNIKEYQSIIERRCETPAINLEVFPDEPGSVKWSSTAYAFPGAGAWRAVFSGGSVSTSGQSSLGPIRLVRGIVFRFSLNDVLLTPPCWFTGGCSVGDFPVDWGVRGSLTYTIPQNTQIRDVIISGSWGDVDNFDSSAAAEIYVDGVLIAECLDGEPCWLQGNGLIDWSFSFANSGIANWQDKFLDGVAEISIIQNNEISVVLSNLRVQIIGL